LSSKHCQVRLFKHGCLACQQPSMGGNFKYLEEGAIYMSSLHPKAF
jgi:hypothetical protein